MAYRLNCGKSLARPFESKYSILRRFVLTNPNISTGDIERNLNKKVDKHSNFINYLVALNYQTHEPPKHLNLIDHGRGTIDAHNITRHCPKCASNYFHTDLFRLPWIKICPAHQIKLVALCPACHQEWPTWQELFTRKCPLCSGSIVNPENANRESSENPAIAKLFNFIMCKLNPEIYLESSLGPPNRRTTITFQHPDYPSYQVVRHPRVTRRELSKMGIKTDSVKVKSFVLYPASIKTYQTSWQTSHSWSAQVRLKVLQEIFNKISKSAPKEHRLWAFNYSRMKPILLNRHPDLCPFCVPLSIWFYLVSSFPFDYKYNPDANGNSLYVGDSYFRLIKPQPMDILSNDDNAYITSRNFQRWLYNRDLQASYKNIFSYTSEIIEGTKLITRLNGRSVVSKPKPDTFNCIDRTLMFYPDNDFKAITVLYLADDLFDGYKHPKFKGTLKKCEYFHRLIEKNYLLNLEKEYESVSPHSGLTRNQLLTLEYGYERFHKEQDLVSTFLSEKH